MGFVDKLSVFSSGSVYQASKIKIGDVRLGLLVGKTATTTTTRLEAAPRRQHLHSCPRCGLFSVHMWNDGEILLWAEVTLSVRSADVPLCVFPELGVMWLFTPIQCTTLTSCLFCNTVKNNQMLRTHTLTPIAEYRRVPIGRKVLCRNKIHSTSCVLCFLLLCIEKVT